VEGSWNTSKLETTDINLKAMGNTESYGNLIEQKNGYGAVRAVIFSTLPNVPTPKSDEFYSFTQVNLKSLDGYCMGICLKCASEVYRFESAGVMAHFLSITPNPVLLDGRQLTPICEGMWMHQEYLDTHTCAFCSLPLRKECTDY
jgi:hypothetical protein